MTLAELLEQLVGAERSFRREADLLGVEVLILPGGRQILIIERGYRAGTGILLDPSSEDVKLARNGDLRQVWNSERLRFLSSAEWDWLGADDWE